MARHLARWALAAAFLAAGTALALGAAAATRGRQLSDEGLRLLLQGRAPEAKDVLEASARLLPAPQAFALLARARLPLSDAAGAAAVLREAIPVSPSPADPMRLLGGILAQTRGREAEAIDLLRRAALLAPVPREEAGIFWLNLGLALLRHGEPAPALQAFCRSLESGELSDWLADGLSAARRAIGLPEPREAYSLGLGATQPWSVPP